MSEDDSPGRRWSDLGAVAGGLAHEIKNPLSTMTINLDLLREDLESATPDTERALRRVQTMEHEVVRLEGILHDFLQFAGRLPL
ncbi:MAG: histidine kinase dimerization/phospho-acceptor domain-containing protein, partial [Planctomycetota bacterium]